MTNLMKVVFIGVNYNSDNLALRFVEGLSTLSQYNVELKIILVDNSERNNSDEFFSMIKSKNQKIVCVKAPGNLGYFGGARLGLTKYLETVSNSDWVIISNVDIEFRDREFIQHLRDCDGIENVGIIAPSIWSNYLHLDKNPKIVERPSKARMKFYKVLFSSFYLGNMYELLSMLKHFVIYFLKYQLLPILNFPVSKSYGVPNELRYIYAPHGSCIIFSKLFFSRGGSLDYPQFLFGEEVYVAELARSLGLRVIYNPLLKVWDDEHVSTGIIRSRKVASYMSESAKYIADTYFS